MSKCLEVCLNRSSEIDKAEFLQHENHWAPNAQRVGVASFDLKSLEVEVINLHREFEALRQNEPAAIPKNFLHLLSVPL